MGTRGSIAILRNHMFAILRGANGRRHEVDFNEDDLCRRPFADELPGSSAGSAHRIFSVCNAARVHCSGVSWRRNIRKSLGQGRSLPARRGPDTV
jgi:hypothetical protein